MIISRIHLAAALLATLTIAAFLSSTVIVEAFGRREAIARVKGLIVMPGLVVLVPALAATGGTGLARARGWKGRLVVGKRKRMTVIAGNGLLILTPAAILLNRWAAAGAFDTWFYVVQAIELVAGGTNLALMGLNIRDGLILSGRVHRRRIVRSPQTPPHGRVITTEVATAHHQLGRRHDDAKADRNG